MLLSICIPSYNRGVRAFSLVKKCLALDPGRDEIEIICSNNGSIKDAKGYQCLAELAKGCPDQRFRYYEFPENRGFAANVNQVLKLSQGEFCLLISDEDEIVPESIHNYIKFLSLHPEISIMQGCSSRVYADLQTRYYEDVEGCLDAFYMMGNYISGRIYNRHVITDALLGTYAHDYAGEEAYKWYPHLFLDAYALVHGSYCSSDLILIAEGMPADSFDPGEDSPDSSVPAFGTYGSRLAQLHGYVQQIHDLGEVPLVQFQMMIRVLERVAEWINLQKKNYILCGHDWKQIVEIVKNRMKEEINFLGLPFGEEDIRTVHEFIDRLMD